jgi:hypothetical protein
MPSIVFNTNRNNIEIVAKGKYFPRIKEALQITITFLLTVFAWIFFRATSLNDAFSYISAMFSMKLLSLPDFTTLGITYQTMLFILFFFITEWFGRENQYAIESIRYKWKRPMRWVFYYLIIISIIWCYKGKEQQFIYFQF